jgi:hypothetical protein
MKAQYLLFFQCLPTACALLALVEIAPKLRIALASRNLAEYERQGTTCYRCFHGSVEGEPGLTIDRCESPSSIIAANFIPW